MTTVQVSYTTLCRYGLHVIYTPRAGAFGPQCINPVEISTLWYNLYIYRYMYMYVHIIYLSKSLVMLI